DSTAGVAQVLARGGGGAGMTYLDRLGRKLTCVGIHGRLRDRILAEAADHLADGEAGRFGDPGALAREFADELATARGPRAALASLAAPRRRRRSLRRRLAPDRRGRRLGRHLLGRVGAARRGRRPRG